MDKNKQKFKLDYGLCYYETIEYSTNGRCAGANCGSDHFLVRSKIVLPWIYSMNTSTEVNQNVQHTREINSMLKCSRMIV
jgi:hypothetical protein